MITNNKKALGIIFPNSYDELIPELTGNRLMASVPFASRYRLIDFVLSGMSNSGMDDIFIMVNKNYHSLIDHLGSGREWDLVRKSGGIVILPPYAIGSSKPYTGRVGALAGVLNLLREQTEKYVVITDTNIAANIDFSKMIDAHIASGADVTIAYTDEEFPEQMINSTDNTKGFYYTFDIDDGRITNIYVNMRAKGVHHFGMNVYVIERELLIDEINTAYVRGNEFFERDVLLPQLEKLNVQAYKYEGYTARISSMQSYFNENMRLLQEGNIEALFDKAPIYTKIRDDNPTRYMEGSKVENIMAADGCVIEGEISDSVLFRGVKIGKGAKVKNCILMQDTVVEDGAELEYVIADKDCVFSGATRLSGADSFPVYVAKGTKI